MNTVSILRVGERMEAYADSADAHAAERSYWAQGVKQRQLHVSTLEISGLDVLRDTIGAMYQVVGRRLLAAEDLTEGQRDRLDVLILDFLASPDAFDPERVASDEALALRP